MSETTPPPPLLLTTAPAQRPLRIDLYLRQVLPSISRHHVHQLIESGLVRIAGRTPKKSHKVGPNERIEIFFEDQQPTDIHAEAIPLQIVHEDEDLLVVFKPSGMVTHPAHGHYTGTLVNALMHHLASGAGRVGLSGEGQTIRPGIVHRLDKGTSGLLVVAKNEVIHRQLTDQFTAREVKRVYRAIVWGRFRKSEGLIEANLGRHPGDRKRFAVLRRGGKTAITTYQVEETFRDTTHLTLRLKTGRTHQIRVHLSHEGHPVFGDATYGGRHKRLGDLAGARRKFYNELLDQAPDIILHAESLGFVHPGTKKEHEFRAEPPDTFSLILNVLRQDSEKELDKIL